MASWDESDAGDNGNNYYYKNFIIFMEGIYEERTALDDVRSGDVKRPTGRNGLCCCHDECAKNETSASWLKFV